MSSSTYLLYYLLIYLHSYLVAALSASILFMHKFSICIYALLAFVLVLFQSSRLPNIVEYDASSKQNNIDLTASPTRKLDLCYMTKKRSNQENCQYLTKKQKLLNQGNKNYCTKEAKPMTCNILQFYIDRASSLVVWSQGLSISVSIPINVMVFLITVMGGK